MALGALSLVPGLASAQTSDPAAVHQLLESAVHGSWRTPAFVARDKWRHPLRTLEFFGIKPDMTVVEVIPGGGWYTEILAPFLKDQGHLIEATTPTTVANPFLRMGAARFDKKLESDPAVYGGVKLEPFMLPGYMHLGAPDSADMVVTFRNMHDMMFANVHGQVTDAMLMRFLRSAYQVLKPGGILGIVGHRARPRMPLRDCFHLARLPEAFAIREAERAGFRLGGSSEVNANPRDNRTLPVFDLPPTLQMRNKDRARFEAIGEADNYTLRFIKPTALAVSAPARGRGHM